MLCIITYMMVKQYPFHNKIAHLTFLDKFCPWFFYYSTINRKSFYAFIHGSLLLWSQCFRDAKRKANFLL